MKLLAPNGKPSNLTPEQYKLVRTPEFKAWFGDWEKAYETGNYDNVSKVIDEETKEPLVVYHGTFREFNVFEISKDGGFYFTEFKRIAEIYATSVQEGKTTKKPNENPIVLTCFLNLKNILTENVYGIVGKNIARINKAKNKRRDGLIIKGGRDIGGYYNQIIAFYPNQIKLADGTNTTFDANNPDIRFNEGGEVLLAPNGKPSNLTPEQYKLVRSDAFISWFGDWENSPETASKVIDENGEPLVVYHGTGNDFNVFKTKWEVEDGLHLIGSHFGTKEQALDRYMVMVNSVGNGRILAVFLNIRNLIRITDEYTWYSDDWRNVFYKLGVIDTRKKEINDDQVYEIFKENKMDGFVYKNEHEGTLDEYNNSYIVLNPNQIKLADGTNTTFDANNPDIRYAGGGSVINRTYFGNKLVVYSTKDYKIAVDNINNARYITLWFVNSLFDLDVKVGSLALYKTEDDFLKVQEIDIQKSHRGKGMATKMYLMALKYSADNIKGIKSYLPDRVNKKQIPKIYKRLNGKIEGDWAYIYKSNNIYANGGEILLAPNGKPSNLTPEQYKLVRTPEFKAWFGDWENDTENASKVVDGNGEPLVVFHGTAALFNVFKSENKGSRGGLNEKFWSFTTNVQQALIYALDKRVYGSLSEPRIIPVFLNIREMPTYDNEGRFYRELKVWGGYKHIDIFQLQDWHDRGFDMGVEFKKVDGFCVKNTIEMEDYGEADKNKLIGDTYYVRNSNQIKLADGTNTTFDSNNPDIRYKKGGYVRLSKTPAPKKERIYGSKVNKPKSSESKSKASSIILSPSVIKSINTILKEHNSDYPNKKIPLATAKAVVRRGMGAYSSTHRPTIKGGKPNSRVAWGLARLNAFVYKIQKGHSKSGKYSQDNDLINELGYRVSKFDGGGNIESLYKDHHAVWAASEKIIKDVCEENCSKYSDKIYHLYELELKPHFEEEENDFFPKALNENNKKAIEDLIKEHKTIADLCKTIRLHRKTSDIKLFCTMIIEHIKKEEAIMQTISADPYKKSLKNGGEMNDYKYFLVLKHSKPIFKVKFSEYNKSTENDMSEMLDRLSDLNYILKPITEKDYKEFDYSKVNKEDIAEFTKNWSFYKEGGIITDEQKETYKKWRELVNMSSTELKNFLDSKEGKVAGLTKKEADDLGIDYGRESARWILKMKDTPYKEWTPNMWRWAKKQISFISRMTGNKGKLFDENGKKTRKYLSLLVWGNNPLKK